MKTAHLPVACSRGSNHWHHCCENCDHHKIDWCNHNECRHHSCHQEDWCKNHPHCKVKDLKKKSYEKIDDCKRNHFKKKNKVMHNDHSSSLSLDILSGKRSCSLSRSPSPSCSHLGFAQAIAKGATQIIMSPMITISRAISSSTSIRTWTTRMRDESTAQKKTIAFLPPLPLQKGTRKSVAPWREQRQQSNLFVPHLESLFQIGNLICWLIVILNYIVLMIFINFKIIVIIK